MGPLRARARLVALLAGLAACGSGRTAFDRARGASSTGGLTNPVCVAGAHPGTTQAPVLVRNLPGETGWFASPLVANLGDGGARVVAAAYGVRVYDAAGRLLDSAAGNGKRIYAPHVVTDLEGDGVTDIVVGQGHQVYAYEWAAGRLWLKAGWPADTTTAGESPEVRGLAAADLDGDGRVEVVATTTQTQPTEAGGAQVFVFSSDGRPYQPAGTPFPAWPRYDHRTGAGGDADRNGEGHHGYGCYGLNVAIGNLDDDPDLEIVVTYDNHEIQVFKADGTAVDASPWFTNRQSAYAGRRLTWGQFIRWADPVVEEDHHHLHTGPWPNPGTGQEWLQWTASPPGVVDLDGDGRNEVVGVPNVEKNEPYETQAYAVMVLEGAHGDGSRSAMRLPGWETLPRGERAIAVQGWYPPVGVPAAATVDIQGDPRPEIVVSLNDGFLYAFDASGQRLWRHDYTHGKPILFSSEPAVVDLDQDGSPEIVFATYGAPGVRDSGHLVVLAANGALLHDVPLPNPGQDGNGNGAPAAPTVADLDGDGQLEILVQTFDHGIDVFTVPGSAPNCLRWPTSRGGPLRTGSPSASRP
jgi:FG-GAP-like repeat